MIIIIHHILVDIRNIQRHTDILHYVDIRALFIELYGLQNDNPDFTRFKTSLTKSLNTRNLANRSHVSGSSKTSELITKLRCKLFANRMWANAQRDGRPAEYRWRHLVNTKVWLTLTTRSLECRALTLTRLETR